MIRRGDDPTRADLFLAPDRDLAGRSLTIRVAYGNGKVDETRADRRPMRPEEGHAPDPGPRGRPSADQDDLARAGRDRQSRPGGHSCGDRGPARGAIAGAVLTDSARGLWSAKSAMLPPSTAGPGRCP